MPTSLVIGASRGLGLELARTLHERGWHVFATVRSPVSTGTLPEAVDIIGGVDVGLENAGEKIVASLSGRKVDLVIINAGIFKAEVGGSASFYRI